MVKTTMVFLCVIVIQNSLLHCKKAFAISLTIAFVARIATVD